MSIEVATFRVNNTLWGINILQVRENIRNIHPTEIPLTPGQIAGLINLRGQIVTIVDMWIHLNYDQAARPKLKENFCIILKTSAELEKVILNQIASSPLVEMGADPVGLLVDVLGDVVTIEESDVDEPPSKSSMEEASHISGVVQMDGELLLLLDLAKIKEIGTH